MSEWDGWMEWLVVTMCSNACIVYQSINACMKLSAGHRSQVTDSVRTAAPGFMSSLFILRLLLARLLPGIKSIVTD